MPTPMFLVRLRLLSFSCRPAGLTPPSSSRCLHSVIAVLVLFCRLRACAGLIGLASLRIQQQTHRCCFAGAPASQRGRHGVLAFASASRSHVQGTFDAGDVPLQSGVIFPNVKIVYEIHGTMNKDKSNVILVSDGAVPTVNRSAYFVTRFGCAGDGEWVHRPDCLVVQHPTSFGARSEDLRYRIGAGSDYTLDCQKYCVVVVNLLGNGLSSSPSHLGSMSGYPMPTMYDNVMLHERLLREELQVDRPLPLIFGYSMGAMAALHFAALFPDKVQRVAAVCGAATVSHYNRVFLASLKAALCADPAWDAGAQSFLGPPARGLQAFGTIYAGWGLSPSFYREEEFLRPEVGDFKNLDDFIERGYVSGFAGADGHDLLAMLHTWDTGDVSANPHFKGDKKAALASIRAKTFLMPCESDRYFTVEDLRREAALFRPGVAELRPIPSSWGHRAGDPHRPGQLLQARFITEQVRALLSIQRSQ